jgi:hypothetical protein
MTTPRKAAANRENALQSTGPKTPEGKALTSKNATRHGVLSALAVVPGLEKVRDWEAHHGGVLAALAPVGLLETLLAERVALGAWRLLRVARYEREAVSLALEAAEESAAEELRRDEGFRAEKSAYNPRAVRTVLRDVEEILRERTRFWASLPRRGETKYVSQYEAAEALQALEAAAETFTEESGALLDDLVVEGLPDGGRRVLDFDGWTVGLLRKAVNALAAAAGVAPEALMEADLVRLRVTLGEAREQERKVRVRVDRLRRSRVVPDGAVLDKVSRYESHLERGLYKALHELQRLQAVRGGAFVPPPAALDVDLTVSRPDREPLEALEAAFEEV